MGSQVYNWLAYKNNIVQKLRSKQKYKMQQLFVSEMIKMPHTFPMTYEISSGFATRPPPNLLTGFYTVAGVGNERDFFESSIVKMVKISGLYL